MTDGPSHRDPDRSEDRATRTAGVVEGYISALNAHDPDQIASFVSDDFHNEHTSAGATGLRGRHAYRERLEAFLATFVDLHYEIEDLIVEDEKAAVAYTMTFRRVDEGGPPVAVTVRGMFRFRLAEGKIVHRVDYWDSGQVQRQIEADRK